MRSSAVFLKMAAPTVQSQIRTNVKILPGAVVCNECDLQGDITIGSYTIIHPKATIIAEAGPIVIGESNLIEEQASIINKRKDGTSDESVLTIGSNNTFEVDSCSESLSIGDNNILESKCYVGRSVELTNGCIIGAGCRLTCTETVPENTVVFGKDCSRRQQIDKPPSQALQMDFLTKVLPNYHHLKRPMKKPT